jgi:hypothetical protein
MTASAMKELNAFARSLEGTKPVAHVADHALIIEIVGNQQIEEGHALVVVLDVGDWPTLA